MKALLFDMDGTLVETEDVHRRAFNAAFEDMALDWHWDAECYRGLLAVSGAVERMGYFQSRLPEAERVPTDRLKEVYQSKRQHFFRLLEANPLPFRAGVTELLDTARAHGLSRAVVTAASRPSFETVAQSCLPAPAEEIFDTVVTGDDVARKKPDPECYLLALARLGCAPEDALVFEDSPVGHAAAVAAGIRVVVTPSPDGPQDGNYGDSLVLPSLEPEYWCEFGFPPAT
ncbi:HAD-IA family hydrolase [Tropicimonas sp. IMCC6043]|uniref:HAD-IA family hydrolase n=1 Tax=Tropicimonas sp. IMCC6043 TaxID=2510645 RepID=UPI00101B77D6|nr:HAD-IA family hydrolase [Tropicimonas sp. IMCC6043]RYH12096.1 HAD family hydrolase [Tropicimonas sp. IMCC6043]